MPEERETWEATPLISVGPLKFGTTHDEVVAALGGSEPELFDAGVWHAGAAFHDAGVTVYYRGDYADGPLRIIAIDAARGPRVSVGGTPLTGQEHSVVEQWMWDQIDIQHLDLMYDIDGSPMLPGLGLAVRAQPVGDATLSAPVFINDQGSEVWEHVPAPRP
ncbi:hypothetical protein [Actinoplanes sp. HUAS TT8]|uniref:hypothetical protein n=1 Tax=Actinoplanes sp. HUAS TT8 TaxID=3447453 RepID=UPI003F51E887